MSGTNGAVAEIVVWVKPPTADGLHKWSQPWVKSLRLLPESDNRQFGGVGSASFRMVRKTGYPNDPLLYGGQYVAISAAEVSSPEQDEHAWFGFIDRINGNRIRGEVDEIGTVTARRFSHALDIAIDGWAREVPSGSPDYRTITSPPTFNVAIDSGEIIGNRRTITVGGETRYVFASRPADGGTVWTRRQALQHLFDWCLPPSIAAIKIQEHFTGTSPLDDTTAEVIDVRGATLRGAIDLIIGHGTGLVWDFGVPQTLGGEAVWPLDVWSTGVDASLSVPLNTPIDITLDDQCVNWSSDAIGPAYDRIIVRGNRIVTCGTVSYANSTADKGWTDDQEDDFLAAAGNDDPQENATYRANPELAEVFRRFIVKDKDSNGKLYCRGADDWTTTQLLCPQIDWDGSTATVSTTDRSPDLMAEGLLSWIPWEAGTIPGTDSRGAEHQNTPTYLHPQVFRNETRTGYKYITEAGATLEWLDMLSRPSSQFSSPSVRISPRGMALTVTMSPPELLAASHWSGADASDVLTTGDGTDVNALERGLTDWQKLAFTIAVESDQFVEVSATRGNILDDDARATLLIERDDINYWLVRSYTVVGIQADNDPEQPTSDTVVRNDFPLAQRILEEAQAWAFRDAEPATFTLARPDNPPSWASLGTMVGTINDGGAQRATKTLVGSIERTWGNAPRMTVRTMSIPAPFSISGSGGGSVSTAAGGAVSRTLGGTLAQGVYKAQKDARRTDAQTQDPLVYAGDAGRGDGSRRLTIRILGGNTLDDSSTGGIKYLSSTLSELPAAYDPSAAPSCADGIGYGQLYRDGGLLGYCLIVNDGRNASAPVNFALIANDVVDASPFEISIAAGAGGGSTIVYAPGLGPP